MVGEKRWDVAIAVAPRRFDFDDPRAEIGEKASTKRPCECHGAVYDRQIFKRATSRSVGHDWSVGCSSSLVEDLWVAGVKTTFALYRSPVKELERNGIQ